MYHKVCQAVDSVRRVKSAWPVAAACGSDFVLSQFLLPARHSYATRQTLVRRLAAMPLGGAVRLRLTALASQELKASPLALFFRGVASKDEKL